MSVSKSELRQKGIIALATDYKSGDYTYTKLDTFIQNSGVTMTPDQRQDLDSYVNANGKLKRNVLDHTRSKMESLIHIINLATKVNDGVCSHKERKVRVRYYNQWKRDYEYGFFYIPDVEFQPYSTHDGTIKYLPTRVAFIEY